MRKLLLYIFSIALLASCKQRTNEEAALEYAIEKQLGEFDFVLENMQDYFDNYNRNRYNLQDVNQIDLRVLNEADRITGWKLKFLKTKKKEDLIAYSDSVTKPEFSWFINRYEKEPKIIAQIALNKKLLKQGNNDLHVQNLFYWALKAERYLVNNQAQMFGGICPAILPHPIYLNQDSYQPGDKVIASFHLSNHKDYIDSFNFNFDSLTITHIPTNQKIARKIVQAGDYVIIETVPENQGEYFIQGLVQITSRTKRHFGRQFERWGNKSFIVK